MWCVCLCTSPSSRLCRNLFTAFLFVMEVSSHQQLDYVAAGFVVLIFVWILSLLLNKRWPKNVHGAFSYHGFNTTTNPLYFFLLISFLSFPFYLFSLFFFICHPFLQPLPTLCALCLPFLSLVTSLLSVLSLPFSCFFYLSWSLCFSLSSGSPSSQSLYVWLPQRHLLHAALSAFGSGQDTAPDSAEQCQAGVCVQNTHHKHISPFSTYIISPSVLLLFFLLHVFSIWRWPTYTRHIWQNNKHTLHGGTEFAGSSSLNLLLWPI